MGSRGFASDERFRLRRGRSREDSQHSFASPLLIRESRLKQSGRDEFRPPFPDSTEFYPLSLRLLGDSAFLYFVGYMWDTANQKEATVAAIDTAMQSDVKFAFDLADPFVVQRYRDDFLEWIPRKVDVLFGNREEISLMLAKKESDESLIRSAAQLAHLVIMKVGAKGCYVSRAGRTFHSPANKVEAVDTIGAGDFFSSGFLFGLIKGLDIEKCACLANSLAAEIVGVKGCSLKNLDQKQILACLDASPR